MVAPLSEKDLHEQQLRGLLATLMLVAGGYRWPGCDGMMIEDVLSEYPKVARLGLVPGREELCLQHPELIAAVTDFFDSSRLRM